MQGILTATLALLLVLAGCTSATQPVWNPATTSPGTYTTTSFTPDSTVEPLSFSSPEEFAAFARSYEGYGGIYYGGGIMTRSMTAGTLGVAIPEMAMDTTNVKQTVPVPAADGVSASAGTDFSDTNNQVEGIDEADIIKTDGEYIYTVTGTTIFIIKAYPGADAQVISTIKLDSTPRGLFIDHDTLVVLGNVDKLEKIGDFTPRNGLTYTSIYDISDRTAPTLQKQFKVEGYYDEARMTDGIVYLITTSGMQFSPGYPVPVIMDGTTIRSMPIDNIRYYPIPYNWPQLVSVHAISLGDESINSAAVVVEGGQTVYMSDQNIYITYTQNINEYDLQRQILRDLLTPKLTDGDKALIEKIKAVDNDILTQQEKDNKIDNIIMSYAAYLPEDEQQQLQDKADELLQQKLKEYEYMEWTIINRVAVRGDTIQVAANGKVPGHITNQFSLDEQDDVLRIATTLSQRWYKGESTKSSNNVFTLDQDLKLLGGLKDLAEGEQIYSTRFIGDRLYMVTFKQVDPFFVIDLSDPAKPKELGKLKIPGFSRYLHPYDDTHIIGIGRDASETGRQQGLKISLFDVSDVTHPIETAKWVSDARYASTTAEYEHKAFLFSKDKDLLVIPAYSYDYQGTGGYNGALVFNITADIITLRGLIDHGQSGYGPAVERSLYIEDLLYTKSAGLLRINSIDTLESVKRVDLVTDSSIKKY